MSNDKSDISLLFFSSLVLFIFPSSRPFIYIYISFYFTFFLSTFLSFDLTFLFFLSSFFFAVSYPSLQHLPRGADSAGLLVTSQINIILIFRYFFSQCIYTFRISSFFSSFENVPPFEGESKADSIITQCDSSEMKLALVHATLKR